MICDVEIQPEQNRIFFFQYGAAFIPTRLHSFLRYRDDDKNDSKTALNELPNGMDFRSGNPTVVHAKVSMDRRVGTLWIFGGMTLWRTLEYSKSLWRKSELL